MNIPGGGGEAPKLQDLEKFQQITGEQEDEQNKIFAGAQGEKKKTGDVDWAKITVKVNIDGKEHKVIVSTRNEDVIAYLFGDEGGDAHKRAAEAWLGTIARTLIDVATSEDVLSVSYNQETHTLTRTTFDTPAPGTSSKKQGGSITKHEYYVSQLTGDNLQNNLDRLDKKLKELEPKLETKNKILKELETTGKSLTLEQTTGKATLTKEERRELEQEVRSIGKQIIECKGQQKFLTSAQKLNDVYKDNRQRLAQGYTQEAQGPKHLASVLGQDETQLKDIPAAHITPSHLKECDFGDKELKNLKWNELPDSTLQNFPMEKFRENGRVVHKELFCAMLEKMTPDQIKQLPLDRLDFAGDDRTFMMRIGMDDASQLKKQMIFEVAEGAKELDGAKREALLSHYQKTGVDPDPKVEKFLSKIDIDATDPETLFHLCQRFPSEFIPLQNGEKLQQLFKNLSIEQLEQIDLKKNFTKFLQKNPEQLDNIRKQLNKLDLTKLGEKGNKLVEIFDNIPMPLSKGEKRRETPEEKSFAYHLNYSKIETEDQARELFSVPKKQEGEEAERPKPSGYFAGGHHIKLKNHITSIMKTELIGKLKQDLDMLDSLSGIDEEAFLQFVEDSSEPELLASTGFASMNKETVENLPLDKVKKVTKLHNIFQKLSDEQLAFIAPKQITNLSLDQLKTLEMSQVAKLNPEAFNNAVNTLQKKGELSPERFASLLKNGGAGKLDPRVVKKLEPSLIKQFGVEHIKELSPEAFTVFPLHSLDEEKLTTVLNDSEQLAKLSEEHLQKPDLLESLSRQLQKQGFLGGLTLPALQKIPLSMFVNLETERFKDLQPSLIQALPLDRLDEASFTTIINKLQEAEQLPHLTGEQLKAMSPEQLFLITEEQYNQLSDETLRSIPFEQFSTSNKTRLLESQIFTKKRCLLETMKKADINSLTESNLGALTQEEVQAIPFTALSAGDKIALINKLKHARKLPDVSANQIGQLATEPGLFNLFAKKTKEEVLSGLLPGDLLQLNDEAFLSLDLRSHAFDSEAKQAIANTLAAKKSPKWSHVLNALNQKELKKVNLSKASEENQKALIGLLGSAEKRAVIAAQCKENPELKKNLLANMLAANPPLSAERFRDMYVALEGDLGELENKKDFIEKMNLKNFRYVGCSKEKVAHLVPLYIKTYGFPSSKENGHPYYFEESPLFSILEGEQRNQLITLKNEQEDDLFTENQKLEMLHAWSKDRSFSNEAAKQEIQILKTPEQVNAWLNKNPFPKTLEETKKIPFYLIPKEHRNILFQNAGDENKLHLLKQYGTWIKGKDLSFTEDLDNFNPQRQQAQGQGED